MAKLCVELGRSRDWDVFVTQTLAPICTRLPEHAGLREVLSVSERARKKQHAGMESSLASQDFQRMLLRFGAWMHGEQWGESETTLEQFAVQVLEKRSKQVSKHGKALVGEDAAQLHLLRIACKKLRYSTEMFGALFAEAKTKDYVAALSELQDILGILNDIAVAHRLLNELDNAARHDTSRSYAAGWNMTMRSASPSSARHGNALQLKKNFGTSVLRCLKCGHVEKCFELSPFDAHRAIVPADFRCCWCHTETQAKNYMFWLIA